MPSRRNIASRGRAFSLVELVVVLVIIGMVASMAIPRVSRAASGAADAALAADLAIVRRALVHYAIEHRGNFPGPSAARFVEQLTQFSDAGGATSPTRVDGKPYGPYLLRVPPIPTGPNQGSATVRIDSSHSPPKASQSSGDGWVYNPNTGEFYPNIGHSVVIVDGGGGDALGGLGEVVGGLGIN